MTDVKETSLESKLEELLSALHRNGQDHWVGKPDQPPLQELTSTSTTVHDASCSTTTLTDGKTIEITTTIGGDLESLLSEYMVNLKMLRTLDEKEKEEGEGRGETVPVKAESALLPDANKEGGGEKTMSQLLEELDNLPPLQ